MRGREERRVKSEKLCNKSRQGEKDGGDKQSQSQKPHSVLCRGEKSDMLIYIFKRRFP